MIFFSFGYQYGELEGIPFVRDVETGELRMLMIDEPSPVIRGIEMGIAVGMIVLGVERMRNWRRRRTQ